MIQKLTIITCSRHNIKICVTCVYQLIPILQRCFRIYPVIRPCINSHSFCLYGSLTGKPFQTSPHTGILTIFFNIFQITICEITVLFCLLLVIFIRTNMYIGTDEYRMFTGKIFIKQSIEEIISFIFIKIKVVHSVFFTANFRFVVCKSKRVCRNIYFGNDVHAIVHSHALQILVWYTNHPWLSVRGNVHFPNEKQHKSCSNHY